ncbi:PilZ domain-containing protein [Allochromatium palmeri]|uniref:PilZ domain-containing protein n=1 Tax=Allochromatium palmeri TaxID=231048 RepID=A0A6N8ECZ2_9GAMM|nr:PilZ domain-containing protein [Allochromatium palmeri]MTW20214.1 PilZ domain-containing protein [Allochromatium palmeri]
MTKDQPIQPSTLDEQNERDRRRYFRIEDRVGLLIVQLDAAAEARLVESLETPSSREGLLNDLHAIRELHLPERRALEYKFPTVATYIKVIESQIEALAQAIGDGENFPNSADTSACLSAQGLALDWPEALALDSRVELRLTLFPDRVHIRSLARVVRCDKADDQPGYRIAVDFVHLREADREAVIRHVYRLQRLQLQAHAEEAFEARYAAKTLPDKPKPKA